MKKLIIFIIRWILTMVLLYGIYTETGIWTTGAFLLIFITLEMVAYSVEKISKILKGVVEKW